MEGELPAAGGGRLCRQGGFPTPVASLASTASRRAGGKNRCQLVNQAERESGESGRPATTESPSGKSGRASGSPYRNRTCI